MAISSLEQAIGSLVKKLEGSDEIMKLFSELVSNDQTRVMVWTSGVIGVLHFKYNHSLFVHADTEEYKLLQALYCEGKSIEEAAASFTRQLGR